MESEGGVGQLKAHLHPDLLHGKVGDLGRNP